MFWLLCGAQWPAQGASRPVAVLHVPHVEAEPVRLDGKTEAKFWEGEAGSTGVLLDAKGLGMVPYSEVKARWGNGKLYLWLNAADLDLQGKVREADADLSGDDAFHIELGGGGHVYAFEVNVLGTLTDAICRSRRRTPRDPMGKTCDRSWQSGADVDVDTDGTVNQLGDADEEWVVELTIPLGKIGHKSAKPGKQLRFSVSRCEVAYDGVRACGSWGMGARAGELVFDP
jgi:hypothetical protein